MHFLVFVITPNKPTHQDIDNALRPFMSEKWITARIGGRWTGYFTDYQPQKDPKNLEKCEECGGSSIVTPINDILLNQDSKLRSENVCPKCDGQGKIIKKPSNWATYEGDSQPIVSVDAHRRPRAIIWKNEWLENIKFSDIYEVVKDNWVTVCDCSK